MGLLDWNEEEYIAVRYEEGLEEGMERGLERGMERGILRGREEGLEEGRQYFMALLNQGLSMDELKERLEVGVSG